jgi:hypothetical protein
MPQSNPFRRIIAAIVAAVMLGGGGVTTLLRDSHGIPQDVRLARQIRAVTHELPMKEAKIAVGAGCAAWEANDHLGNLNSPDPQKAARAQQQLHDLIRSQFPDPMGRALAVESAATDVWNELSDAVVKGDFNERKLSCGAIGLLP